MEEEDRLDASVLVANLVASRETVVPSLRSVLERASGSQKRVSGNGSSAAEALGRGLDEYVAKKEDELRMLCNNHFSEFSQGAQEIYKLKMSAAELKKALSEVNSALQTHGKSAVTSSESLLRFYKIERNLRRTKRELRRALACVKLVRKARGLAKQKAYFEALQTIDLVREVVHGKDIHRLLQIEEEGIERQIANASVEKEAQFGLTLERWIPRIMEEIKSNVNEALTDWFYQAHESAGKIGASAIDTMQRRGDAGTPRVRPESPKNKMKRANARSRASSMEALLLWEQREPMNTVNVADTCMRQEQLTLSPIQEYFDIQNYLGTMDAGIEFYKKNRLPQASLQSMLPVDINKLKPGQFAKYAGPLFEKITGFFIIEGSVSRALNLIPQFELSALWEDMLSKLVPLIESALLYTKKENLEMMQMLMDISSLLGRTQRIKEASGVCITSNRILDTSKLLEICYAQRIKVGQSLLASCEMELSNILNNDKTNGFSLQSVRDPADRQEIGIIVQKLTLSENPIAEEDVMSFSEVVPFTCMYILRTMERGFHLARQLGGSLSLEDDTEIKISNASQFETSAASAVKIATAGLAKLHDLMEEVSRNENSGPELLCQYSENLEQLFKMRDLLETHAKEVAKLQGEPKANWWSFAICEKFKETAAVARSRVDEALRNKLDLLVTGNMNDEDWAPSEMPEGPHAFLKDAVQYLSVMFGELSCLRLLPEGERQNIHLTAFSHLSETLFGILCGDELQEVNALSIYQFKLDVDLLKEISEQTEIAALGEVLAPISQLIFLFLNADLAGYQDPAKRGKYYYLLNEGEVLQVLRKYKQPPTSTRLLSTNSDIKIIKQSEIQKILGR